MRLNGSTKKYGIVGHPVEHSFSPFLQNLLADKTGIDAVYVPLHVKKEHFDMLITSLKTLDFDGVNVTVPYKVDVMSQLDLIDEKAALIGAVNTVHFKEGLSKGYNTDAPGLLLACKNKGIDIKNKHVLIIGAGGAAQSVAVISAAEGAKKITVVNRTLEKAEKICDMIKEAFGTACETLTYSQLSEEDGYEVAFQTTSVGMSPKVNETPISKPEVLSSLAFAVDIIYNPMETKFMKDMKALNVNTVNGLDMLFYQAVIAFEIWHNMSVEDEVVTYAYKQFLDYFKEC